MLMDARTTKYLSLLFRIEEGEVEHGGWIESGQVNKASLLYVDVELKKNITFCSNKQRFVIIFS